jgi:hypothetical protein
MTGPRFKKPKTLGPHYVSNPAFYQALKEYHATLVEHRKQRKNSEPPRPSEYIGRCIMLICERLSLKPNFIGYAHRDEMIGDAICLCSTAIKNFNPNKSTNPFAYFTSIAYNAFLRRIADEKAESYIKCKNLHRIIPHEEATADGEYKSETLAVDAFVADFERKMVGRRKIRRARKPRGIEKFMGGTKGGFKAVGVTIKH